MTRWQGDKVESNFFFNFNSVPTTNSIPYSHKSIEKKKSPKSSPHDKFNSTFSQINLKKTLKIQNHPLKRARVESSVLLLNQLITTTDPTSKYSIFLQIEPQKPPHQNPKSTSNRKHKKHKSTFFSSTTIPSIIQQPLRLPPIQTQRTFPLIAHQANPRTNKNRKEKGNGNHLLVLRQSVHRSGSGVDGRVGRLRHCKSRRRRGGDESLGVPLHRSLTERPFPFDY